jgi:hypothetical protein
MSACDRMSKADLAKLYDVTAEDIIWMDSASNERMTTLEIEDDINKTINPDEYRKMF